ncbi:MAG: LysR family transcriptional regulator [Victivallales bacterium]|nr:LysR family transcriptional regulator [Victivallales bacterium]
MMIDKRLQIFQLIYELKSFSAAAAMLGMSQPNATQQLKKLERELGVRLFERDTRSIRLTEAGRLVKDELPALNTAAARLALKLSGLKDRVRSFALGGTMTAGNFILPGLMAGFMQRYAGINLHLAIGNTVTMAEKIQQGALELALVEGPFDRNLFLHRKLMDDELLAAGLPGKLGGDFDLTEYLRRRGRIILREHGSGTRYYFDRFCREHGLEVPGACIITAQSFEAIKQLVLSGVGITVISPVACRAETAQRRLVCVPFAEGRINREFNFIYSASSDPELVEKFLPFSRTRLRDLAPAPAKRPETG